MASAMILLLQRIEEVEGVSTVVYSSSHQEEETRYSDFSTAAVGALREDEMMYGKKQEGEYCQPSTAMIFILYSQERKEQIKDIGQTGYLVTCDQGQNNEAT